MMKISEDSPRVALTTLGCKVNQYESAALAEAFTARGFHILPFAAEADCYVINTCTVTDRTDFQSRQMVRRASRRNPEALIVVTGCYAQTNADELAGLSAMAVVIGNHEKNVIPRIVAELWEERKQNRAWGTPLKNYPGPCNEKGSFYIPAVEHFPGHTRAFLKIQDGCNAFCSYCIVPHARGRSRSLPRKDALDRIMRLADAGYREVVLTGIHLGAYGQDGDPPANLTDLLDEIEARHCIERLRLSSIEPLEITDDFLKLFQRATVVCPHLHIPLQSGDDGVLARMNRHYDTAFFRRLVERIVSLRPETALGLDVMVGFPGEDERAFRNTYRLIEEIPVAYLHVFPYSKRPGTPAALMQGQTGAADKKERAEQLRNLGREKRRAFMERFLHRKLQVLIEGRVDKKNGFYKGFSNNYLPVAVRNSRPDLANTIAAVTAVEIADGGIIGEMADE